MTQPRLAEPKVPGPTEDQEPRLNPKDLVGHLCLIWTVEHLTGQVTKFTKAGETQEAVVVDVVDLCHDPKAWRRQTWWPLYLIGALKDNVNDPDPVLAVVQLGVPTKGNPPFELLSMSQNPRAVQMYVTWLQQNPVFVKSTPAPPPQQTAPYSGQPVQNGQRVPVTPSWTPPAQAAQPAAPVEQFSILDQLRQQQAGPSTYSGTGLPPAAPQQPDEPPF